LKLPNADRWIAAHAPGVILVMAALHLPAAAFAMLYARWLGSDVRSGLRTAPAARAMAIVVLTIGLLLIFSGMLSLLRSRDTRRAVSSGNERARWVEPLVTMASLILLTLTLLAAVMIDTFVLADIRGVKPVIETWLVIAAGICTLLATIFYILGVVARREKIGPPLLMDALGTAAILGAAGTLVAIGVMKLLGS